MSRPLRIEYPGAHYHVMNRGLSRHDIFFTDSDRQQFLRLLGETCEIWKTEVYGYALMDNHYHILLATMEVGLSRAMRHLGGVYTQRFNQAHGRDGPLFRGRYKGILVDAEEYFLSVARYIHQNPLPAGMVNDIDDYRWSSHASYLNPKRGPEWLDTEVLLSRFGRGRSGLKEYQRFMHSGLEREVEEYYSQESGGPILGSKEFVQWVQEKVGGRGQVEEEKPESRRVFGVTMEEIIVSTAEVYGVTVEQIVRSRRGEENEARAVAVYLGRQIGGHKLRDIGRAVGLEKYSSVSTAYLKMKSRIQQDPKLARRTRRVQTQLLRR